MTRNRGTPDHAGEVIERCVERLKDIFVAEMKATHRQAGDRPYAGCNPCRASTPVASMTPRCKPSRQAPARIIIGGSNIKIRGPTFTTSTYYFRNTYFYVRVHT